MKILFRFILLAAVLALGWWLWTYFFPAPEKIIRQRLTRLAETCTFAAKDSVFVRATKAQRAVNFFSADAELIIDISGAGGRHSSGRDEITEAAHTGFAVFKSLAVKFLNITVKLAADQQTAEVSCTAEVRFEDSKDFGVQEMRFQFKNVSGNWLITRAETVKTLS
jgi:hypothetical protein